MGIALGWGMTFGIRGVAERVFATELPLPLKTPIKELLPPMYLKFYGLYFQ